MKSRVQYLPGLFLLAFASLPLAGQVSVPHTFVSGEQAMAEDVNDNFAALQAGILALQARVQALEDELEAVASSALFELEDHVYLVADDYGNQTVLFTGVNVQIVNGIHQSTPNGLGNLIVGYNQPRNAGVVGCSLGQYTDIGTCQSGGGVWQVNHKSGSHNIVVGNRNAYSQTGGLVAGFNNSINREYAVITGGHESLATGIASSVSGGGGHFVASNYSSVNGGYNNGTNQSGGAYSSILGGRNNGTLGAQSVVLGGNGNAALSVDQIAP
jgi:hypothetical protein